MAAEQSKELVRRSFEELWNRGNLAALGEYFADDVVNHPVAMGAPSGLAVLRQGYEVFFAGFPDPSLTIDDLLATETRSWLDTPGRVPTAARSWAGRRPGSRSPVPGSPSIASPMARSLNAGTSGTHSPCCNS
jgi:ketosteroid isomerase-like protein